MEVRVEFPLDSDGFLRRECPSCVQEFKWHHGPTEGRPVDTPDPPRHTCPLCGKQANHDQWFTQDQLRCRQEIVNFYAQDVVNDAMKQEFGRNYKPGRSNAPAPTVLQEPNDMLIIEPPCHPWEPVKVTEERADSGPLFCLICGEMYSA
jgi:hypothetical protein